jgi:PAS domain S-box-containing protein
LRDGTILTANQTLADLLGYDSVSELLTRNLARDIYFEPEDRRSLIAEFEKREIAGDVEIQWKRKDGSPLWVHLVAHAFKVAGVTQFFEGFVRDVTDEKRAQDALAGSEQRYRELFENSRDAIYVHDINGRYTSVNHAAEELCGYDRAEIIGKHYSNFIAPSYLREARESFCRKLDVPMETTYEAEVICKDGTRKAVEVSSRMIYQDGEPFAVQGTVRDITELKRAQRTLQTYSQRLIQAQEAERESMSRELHDEVGQALTAISMNLEWIHRTGQPSEAVAARIHESIEVIDDTLRRVRELSLELRPALLDDLGLAAALSWYAERFSARTGIVTEVIGECPHDRTRRAAQTALFRIAQEALTNTARHSRASKAVINLDQRDGHLQMSISDDGVGFDSDALLNGSPVMALGLRGMQERALALNGSLQINSLPGSGTRLIVAVPLAS